MNLTYCFCHNFLTIKIFFCVHSHPPLLQAIIGIFSFLQNVACFYLFPMYKLRYYKMEENCDYKYNKLIQEKTKVI